MSRAVWISLAVALTLGVLAVRLSRVPVDGIAARRTQIDSQVTGETVPPIRVLLGSSSRESALIRVDGSYRVTTLDDWRVLAQGDRLDSVEVRPTLEGLQIGAQAFPARRLKLEVFESGTLWLDGHRYRGSLLLLSDSQKQLRVINIVTLEAYLASVLPSEMPGSFPEQAQLAQAIVSRTYALYRMKTYGRSGDFDVYGSTRSQAYLGMQYTSEDGRPLAVETARSRGLVEQTRGMVLAYQGRVFCSFYSAMCGGHTTDGPQVFKDAAPPLVGVSCPHCAEAPNFKWTQRFPLAEVEQKLAIYLRSRGKRLGHLRSVTLGQPRAGELPVVEFVGDEGTHSMSAEQLRSQVLGPESLLSTNFQLSLGDQRLEFQGQGRGHGVGMCQWGARGRAHQGASCLEILQHYYPGSELVRIE